MLSQICLHLLWKSGGRGGRKLLNISRRRNVYKFGNLYPLDRTRTGPQSRSGRLKLKKKLLVLLEFNPGSLRYSGRYVPTPGKS
jgi:hypothetical protein